MGKAFMAMLFMFVVVNIAGGVLAGEIPFVRTRLSNDITDADDTIEVDSIDGFAVPGIAMIGDERIAYSVADTIAGQDTLMGTTTHPLIRGSGGTDAVAHDDGDQVSPLSGGLLNLSMNYHIAVIVDSSGWQTFLAKPIAFFQLIGSLFTIPLQFLGTDLQILAVFWSVLLVGMTVALVVSLAGGRRV